MNHDKLVHGPLPCTDWVISRCGVSLASDLYVVHVVIIHAYSRRCSLCAITAGKRGVRCEKMYSNHGLLGVKNAEEKKGTDGSNGSGLDEENKANKSDELAHNRRRRGLARRTNDVVGYDYARRSHPSLL